MRELKFRAWHKILRNYAHIKRIWLDGDADGHDEIFAVSDVETTYPIHEVVLEQYTGLKDKNGKEIYEGDIVVWSGQKYAIRWHEGAHGVWQNNIQHFYVISVGIAKSCEIIGNIHENPELLEHKG